MTCLGVDYGERRIGFAVSDELGMTADPLMTLSYREAAEVWKKMTELLRELNIDMIVVGIPKRTSGEEGPEAKKVRAFIEELKHHIQCAVETWDERFSSREADRLLQELEISPARKRQKRDAIAAKIMLQNYLDFKRIQGQSCTN